MAKTNEIVARRHNHIQSGSYSPKTEDSKTAAPVITSRRNYNSPTAYLERIGFDQGKYRQVSLSFKQTQAREAVGGAARGVSKPPVSNKFKANPGTFGSRGGTDIDAIILHHTAGSTASGAASALNSRGLSVHYVLDKDGTIYQMVGDEKRAFHAGQGSGKWANANSRSIGIEIVNLGNGKDKYTEAQYKALEKLVPYLAEKYNISVKNIVGHSQIGNPGRPAGNPEPSPNFDWNRVRRSVNGTAPALNPNPPTPSPNPNNPGKVTAPTAFLERGDNNGQVKKLQDALVKLSYMKRGEIGNGYGNFGPKTERALRAFQRDHTDGGRPLVADGIYGPKTRRAMQKALSGGNPAPAPNPTPNPSPGSGAVNIENIVGVENNPHVTAAFRREVNQMAKRLDTKPEFLLAVMSFESGLNPRAVNPVSNATGLIQFLPSTARGLGTSTAALKNMSSIEQLKYVEKYLKPFAGRLGTLEGIYTSVLSGSPHPNANDVLFRSGTTAYSQNRGLDFNRNGQITSGEATSAVAAKMFGGTRHVQQRLKNLGFDPKGIDGIFGANTSKAIAAFQRSRKLPATGLLNVRTGLALVNGKAAPPANPPAGGNVPTFKRWEVYSTGDSAAKHADGWEDLQPHHGPSSQWTHYVSSNVSLNHNLLKRDIVLTRSGQSNFGQAVPSPLKGKVLFAGNENDGYGNKVVVKNESTGQIMMIGHLESISVRRGQNVAYGQKLGGQGSTGNSTGAHVHINADSSVIKRWVADLADGKFDGVRRRFNVDRNA